MTSDLYAAIVLIVLVYNGIRSLIKAIKPPPANPLPRPTATQAAQQAPMTQASQRPLAGPYANAAPGPGQLQQRLVQPGEGGRQTPQAVGGQPGPGQPQRRPMQPGEGGRQTGPQPDRLSATTQRPARANASKIQTVQSQAPMSGTAIAFAKERRESDQEFAAGAQEQRDYADATEQTQAAASGTVTFPSGRYSLIDAIVLSQALGQPVCRRQIGHNRKIGHTITP